MSRPVVALCQWQDFNYAEREPGSALYRTGAPIWVDRPEPPTACRASLGSRILTVWLPQGAVIRCRLARFQPDTFDAMRDNFRHVFGSHERMSRTNIRITLTDLPNLGA
jgi:hypothetical protein